MNEMLILGGIVLASWLGLIYLRVPSSIAFLSLLIGQLLATQASEDVFGFLGSMLQIPRVEYIKAALLVLPLLLTLAFLRNHVAKSKMLVEALPLVFIVALITLLLAPFIEQLQSLVDAATRNQTEAYKSIIVVAASISGLLSAWLSYPKSGGEHHKSAKHHK
jgi:type III secretory pathway component EscS